MLSSPGTLVPSRPRGTALARSPCDPGALGLRLSSDVLGSGEPPTWVPQGVVVALTPSHVPRLLTGSHFVNFLPPLASVQAGCEWKTFPDYCI